MDKSLLKCRAADSLVDCGVSLDKITDCLEVKKSTIYNMVKVWEIYNRYHPTLEKWNYTQIVALIPVSDKIPDFFARMGIDCNNPLSYRTITKKVSEYKMLNKATAQTFCLTRDDNFIKIEGRYIPLSPEEREQLKKWFMSGETHALNS